MEKKSVAASILVLFLSLIFAVIGICFSSFVYKDTRIMIENITLKTAQGIEIFENKDLTKTTDTLKLSDMELGLKPATGEVDQETQIPSTIDDQGTSEGYYATIYVKTSINFEIVVNDVKIETQKNQIEADEEKKNIFISIKGRENTTKSLENETTEIATFENVSETLEFTFYIWLGSLASDALEGSKITFTLEFLAL